MFRLALILKVELMYEGPHFHSCSGLAHNAEEEDGFPFSEDVVGEEGIRIPASVLRERFCKLGKEKFWMVHRLIMLPCFFSASEKLSSA